MIKPTALAKSPQALHVGRPNIGARETFLRRVNDILDRRWLTNAGPYVQEFEGRVAELLGVEHCVAMCNATIALSLTARALDLSGEIIMPSFTFIATPHALQWQEMRPVFCDIDPATHNIDPAKIESLITPQTTGILAVHLWGRPCAVEELEAIAQRHSLQLFFDASHAFGCTHRGKMIGGFGRAEVFSFHATKFIHTLEGGLVATNDGALADKLRLMKNFGFTDYDRVDHLGINGKMNEISAAMGLTNLEAFDEFMEVNRRNYKLYRDELRGCAGLELLSFAENEKNNRQYVVLEIDHKFAGISRDELVHGLYAGGIVARRYFYPGCHRLAPYNLENARQAPLPETEKVAARVLCLPTGASVKTEEIHHICRLLRQLLADAKKSAA